MKRICLMFLLFGLLAAFSIPAFAQDGCMDALGCVEIAADDPVVIGAMLSVSGATSFYGEDSLGGIELAISGRDGMLLGREITLVVEDSLCSAEGGQAAAQRVAADETIVGVIGTTCSGAAQGAMPIIRRSGHGDDFVFEYIAELDQRRHGSRRHLPARLFPHRA